MIISGRFLQLFWSRCQNSYRYEPLEAAYDISQVKSWLFDLRWEARFPMRVYPWIDSKKLQKSQVILALLYRANIIWGFRKKDGTIVPCPEYDEELCKLLDAITFARKGRSDIALRIMEEIYGYSSK